MTSLNNFKMVDRQVDEPVIPPNLDTMLGNLQVGNLLTALIFPRIE